MVTAIKTGPAAPSTCVGSYLHRFAGAGARAAAAPCPSHGEPVGVAEQDLQLVDRRRWR